MVGGLRRRAANDSGAEAPAYHPAMRKLLMLLLATFLAPCALATSLRDGDIIFHTSRSAQSAAIQRATHSRYSHVVGWAGNTGGRSSWSSERVMMRSS